MQQREQLVAHCEDCLRALAGAPMSPAEKRTYDIQRAEEMHRAELRRAESPQLDLRA